MPSWVGFLTPCSACMPLRTKGLTPGGCSRGMPQTAATQTSTQAVAWLQGSLGACVSSCSMNLYCSAGPGASTGAERWRTEGGAPAQGRRGGVQRARRQHRSGEVEERGWEPASRCTAQSWVCRSPRPARCVAQSRVCWSPHPARCAPHWQSRVCCSPHQPTSKMKSGRETRGHQPLHTGACGDSPAEGGVTLCLPWGGAQGIGAHQRIAPAGSDAPAGGKRLRQETNNR